MFCLFATSDRELLDGKPYLIAAISLGGAVGVAWLVGSRWLTDHLNKEEYGEIVRAFDENASMTQRPYYFVAFVALFLGMGSVIVLVSYENMPRWAVATSYSVLFALAIYTILGSISLGLITYRHTSRASRVRALKERAARDARLRDAEGKNGG